MLLIRRINNGGFGAVDEVELPDGRRVARKTYAPSPALLALADEPKLRARFKREARIQAQLDAQFFVPIIGTELDDANPYYVMPLADSNLDAEIQSLRLTGDVPVQALADILNSLEKLHELGFVHRDLKPQNVLLHESVWKLGDFGLVLPPAGETTKLTSVHSAWGTAAYCAPEQALQFGNVTSAADVYAFGCILHDILVGTPRVPYQRHSGPGPLGTIIEKCTEVRPTDRFRSVTALRSALLPLLASSRPTQPTAVPASGWAAAVQSIASWDTQKFRDLLQFMAETTHKYEMSPILLTLGDEELRVLYDLEPNLWARFAGEYCEWVEKVGFDFGVCDVVVKRLEVLFELGSPQVQAQTVLAAAELGRSHNRWFVMGRVLKLCGPTMDDTLAHRIAIEIMASDARLNFRLCAQKINRSVDDYHPRIAEILKPYPLC